MDPIITQIYFIILIIYIVLMYFNVKRGSGLSLLRLLLLLCSDLHLLLDVIFSLFDGQSLLLEFLVLSLGLVGVSHLQSITVLTDLSMHLSVQLLNRLASSLHESYI